MGNYRSVSGLLAPVESRGRAPRVKPRGPHMHKITHIHCLNKKQRPTSSVHREYVFSVATNSKTVKVTGATGERANAESGATFPTCHGVSQLMCMFVHSNTFLFQPTSHRCHSCRCSSGSGVNGRLHSEVVCIRRARKTLKSSHNIVVMLQAFQTKATVLLSTSPRSHRKHENDR